MKIVFRTDASLEIGSGHVMRCLSLADAFKAKGAQCVFISREHPGHMLDMIRQRGHEATGLPARSTEPSAASGDARDHALRPAHARWLGCDWQADAQQTRAILATVQPDWLVVDHYALDQRWEATLQPYYQKLLVIDDLADRAHRCDMLLDQNLGREAQDYASLVPAACRVLAGPRYALLRPEFAALRDYSIERRADPQLRQLLITMGGVDLDNATARVLDALTTCALPRECRITVVMGASAPWLEEVRELAKQMPWQTEVLVNISDIARRMANSDLAIGAAGSTSWERCCLGVPTLMVALADNQRVGANALQEAGAAWLMGDVDQVTIQLPLSIEALRNASALIHMSSAATALVDGQGVDQVLRAMEALDD
jgi:UDP-2,4-diacetamido-2,4,6-trideoxy-beta-L-altropyranose hydrolase